MLCDRNIGVERVIPVDRNNNYERAILSDRNRKDE